MKKTIFTTFFITALIASNMAQGGYIYLIESNKVIKQCAYVDPTDILIKSAPSK